METQNDDFLLELSQDAMDCLCDETAFPSEPMECGSCGKRVGELYPCGWAEGLEVGTCCLIHEDQEPLCGCVETIAEEAGSVEQFIARLREHLATCPECGKTPPRKPVQPAGILPNLSVENQEVA